MSARNPTPAQVARIVRNCLERGGSVEIDGLGSFRREASGRYSFVPQNRPKVFMAYVVEDAPEVERLYEDLSARGFEPWLDRRKLLPGQNWPRAIDQAISVSDFFLACFSHRSVGKRGRFHSELRYALDCNSRQPLEDVFLIPVRLDDCAVPSRVAQEFHWVDMFPDWNRGLSRLVNAMRRQERQRRLALSGLAG